MGKKFLQGLVLLLAVVVMPRVSFAEELTLARQVFIEPGQFQKSNAIVRTNDGGFVIAGSLGPHEGWAIRTDADGNVKWRYTIPLIDPPKGLMEHPDYSDVAIMPDDSIYLCGSMPRARGVHTPPLLTHLDKDGKPFDEQMPYLYDDQSHTSGRFLKCMAWDDGLLIIGVTSTSQPVTPTAQHPLPIDQHNFYWLVALDKNGKKKWENLIPATEMGGYDEVTILPRPDGSFVFAGARNTVETELVHVSKEGAVEKRKTLPNEAYLIVQPVDKKDSKLQLVSVLTKDWLTTITFNDDLEETSHSIEPAEHETVKVVYRVPDQSLLLFGSQFPYKASVLRMDAALKNLKKLFLLPNSTTGAVTAAVPGATPGQFVCIRDAVEPSDPYKDEPHEVRLKEQLGVGLAFIDIRQHQ